MTVDWNVWGPIIGAAIGAVIGAVISFILAIRLVYFKDRKKKKKENKKKKKLFEDLFNGFCNIYKDEGCILLFRTIPLILEDIQQKLQMITNINYKKKLLIDVKNEFTQGGSAWIYDHEWIFKLNIEIFNFSTIQFKFDTDYTLNNIKEDFILAKKKQKNDPEILINFLKYLENEYRNANIIGKEEILLSKERVKSIKSHYSTKNGN